MSHTTLPQRNGGVQRRPTVRICPLNPQDWSLGDKDWGLSFPVLLSQLLPRRINSKVIWGMPRCPSDNLLLTDSQHGSRGLANRHYPDSSADGYSLQRINGLTDQKTSHISDASASRNNLPVDQWERQDLLTHGRYSTRRLASAYTPLRLFGSNGAWGQPRGATSAAHRPPPVWGFLVGRLGAHTPTLALF